MTRIEDSPDWLCRGAKPPRMAHILLPVPCRALHNQTVLMPRLTLTVLRRSRGRLESGEVDLRSGCLYLQAPCHFSRSEMHTIYYRCRLWAASISSATPYTGRKSFSYLIVVEQPCKMEMNYDERVGLSARRQHDKLANHGALTSRCSMSSKKSFISRYFLEPRLWRTLEATTSSNLPKASSYPSQWTIRMTH